MSNHQPMNVDNLQQQQNETNLNSQITLQTLTTSLSNLSTSSHTLPSNKDFHFYNNFDSFKNPVCEISIKAQSLLQAIGSTSNEIFDEKFDFSNVIDNVDETCDLLVNVNDDIFDMFDSSIDEYKRTRNGYDDDEPNVRDDGGESAEGDGFQVVSGKKKKVVKVVEKKKVSFHVASIRRPQDEFNILVNNSNVPFEHVWLQRSDDGLRPIHHLEKMSVLDFVDDTTQSVEPVPPPPLESTPFKLVEEVKDLKELMNKLRGVNEFAVDLEHNQYRSFQGLTCLMQISTRTEDFVVDTLKLCVHVGPYLREAFKDPTKKKVMHGADRDIIWLQKDFGIYVCNMFDTGQASRVLKLERNSLEYLLRHYCDVTANKEYQNADWRIRPIPDEMLRYAREDTHYLLYIYDLMKKELISMPNNTDESDSPLIEVYKRSYDICMQLYEKELLTETSYLHLYGLPNAGFNAQQLAIVSGLFEWRDVIARTEDESTGYILPNKTLLEIAKHKPVTSSQLRRVLKSKHPYVERNLESVVNIIRHSMRNSNAFESAVSYLKERQRELAMRAANTEATDGREVSASDSPTKLENGNDAMDSGGHATSPITKNEKRVFVQHQNQNSNISFASSNQAGARESLSVSLQSRDTISSSPKGPGAMVQVQKKPNKGFGALLGRPAAKRRPDLDKKDAEDSKLEKIRSSVNLPFHSVLGRTEPAKLVVERVKIPEIQRPEERVATTAATQIQRPENVTANATDSSQKEIIDVDDDELDINDSEPTTNMRNDKINVPDIARTEEPKKAAVSGFEDVIILDEDNDDLNDIENYGKSEEESVSLSELSTSFEKCLQSTSQNKKPTSKKSQEPSGLGQFKPFNYAAAIGMVKFSEDEGEDSEAKDKKDDSEGRKKNASRDGGKKDNGSREFLPARRRQAFPASGNRSATFR